MRKRRYDHNPVLPIDTDSLTIDAAIRQRAIVIAKDRLRGSCRTRRETQQNRISGIRWVVDLDPGVGLKHFGQRYTIVRNRTTGTDDHMF